MEYILFNVIFEIIILLLSVFQETYDYGQQEFDSFWLWIDDIEHGKVINIHKFHAFFDCVEMVKELDSVSVGLMADFAQCFKVYVIQFFFIP